MDYGFGKTYTLPGKFTALNGCVQYYTLVFTNVALTSDKVITDESSEADKLEVATAQANLLRALEVLRSYGAQPVITAVEEKTLKFTLEQANVYGDAAKKQPSAKDLLVDAKAQIEALFAGVMAVDGKTSFACTATVEEAF